MNSWFTAKLRIGNSTCLWRRRLYEAPEKLKHERAPDDQGVRMGSPRCLHRTGRSCKASLVVETYILLEAGCLELEKCNNEARPNNPYTCGDNKS